MEGARVVGNDEVIQSLTVIQMSLITKCFAVSSSTSPLKNSAVFV